MDAALDQPPTALRLAATSYLDAIENQFPRLTSRFDESLKVRQMAAAWLARCISQTRAVFLLADNGHADHVDLLVRTAAESWIDGTYVLLGGEEHLKQMMRRYTRVAKLMQQGVPGFDISQGIASWTFDDDTPEEQRKTAPGVEQRMKYVHAELASRGLEPPDDLATTVYDLLYRGTSTLGVHGFGAAHGYVHQNLAQARFETLSRSKPTNDPENMAAVTALYAGHLAELVFEAFGLGTSEIEQLAVELGQVLRDQLTGPITDS